MIVEKTIKNETILFGEVISWKPGSVDKEDLTILTLSDIHTRQNIKVLCWNQEHGSKLSDRARKFQIQDRISVKVNFDVGNPNKCIASDLKKSGIYRIQNQNGKWVNIVHGKIRGIKKTETGLAVMIPVYRFSDSKIKPCWYCINYNTTTKNKNYINGRLRKGAQVFAYFYNEKELEVNGISLFASKGEQLTVVA